MTSQISLLKMRLNSKNKLTCQIREYIKYLIVQVMWIWQKPEVKGNWIKFGKHYIN